MIKTAKHIDYYLIGISNHPTPVWNSEVLQLIKNRLFFLVENVIMNWYNHIYLKIIGGLRFREKWML